MSVRLRILSQLNQLHKDELQNSKFRLQNFDTHFGRTHIFLWEPTLQFVCLICTKVLEFRLKLFLCKNVLFLRILNNLEKLLQFGKPVSIKVFYVFLSGRLWQTKPSLKLMSWNTRVWSIINVWFFIRNLRVTQSLRNSYLSLILANIG